MDWTTLFKDICLAFVPVVGLFACTALHSIADYFVGKTNDTTTQKYIREIEEAIIKAVRTVAQTYTKKLKAQNAFGEAEEKIANRKAIEVARASLSSGAVSYISKTYGDVDTFLSNGIESTLNAIKDAKKN